MLPRSILLPCSQRVRRASVHLQTPMSQYRLEMGHFYRMRVHGTERGARGLATLGAAARRDFLDA